MERERERLQKEREKLLTQSKSEARRIINERTAMAEELLAQIEEVFAKDSISEADLIKARTLKNKLGNIAYISENEEESPAQYKNATEQDLRVGVKVILKNTKQEGIVQSVRSQKKEAEILCGNIRIRSKFSDLALLIEPKKAQTVKKKDSVQVNKSLTPKPAPSLELNVIGLTVHEAIPEVEAFLDSAVIANLEEVRIVHGMGTGKLRAGIHEFLRTQKRVSEYRLGKYGEGDTGVTIVKLK